MKVAGFVDGRVSEKKTIIHLEVQLKRRRNMKFYLLLIFSFAITRAMSQNNLITRKNLETALVDQKVSRVEIQEITFPAGQTAPKHSHPCPVVGYIKSGSVLFQVEGKESIILKEGDSFYEPKNVNILHFDNATSDKPMTFIAFYLKEGSEENVKLLR